MFKYIELFKYYFSETSLQIFSSFFSPFCFCLSSCVTSPLLFHFCPHAPLSIRPVLLFLHPPLFFLFLSSPSFLLQNVLYCLRLSSVLFSSISSPSLHLSPAFGFTRLPRYSSISFSSCSSFSFAPLFRFLAYSFIKPPFRWPLMSPSLLKNSVALVNASA